MAQIFKKLIGATIITTFALSASHAWAHKLNGNEKIGVAMGGGVGVGLAAIAAMRLAWGEAEANQANISNIKPTAGSQTADEINAGSAETSSAVNAADNAAASAAGVTKGEVTSEIDGASDAGGDIDTGDLGDLADLGE